MTAQVVDAVFIWKMEADSVFKPVYGRNPMSGSQPDPVTGKKEASYTKDYLQPDAPGSAALEKVLGRVPAAEDGAVPFVWRWPGGEVEGTLRQHDKKMVRKDLAWPKNHPPTPWRLKPSPQPGDVEVLAGTPDLGTPQLADQQFQNLVATGEHPWLLAVHLAGEGPVLHTRVVFENPTPAHADASLDLVPPEVRAAVKAFKGRQVMGFVEYRQGADMSNELALRIMDAFEDSPNVLLVGPPGTGKTVAMELVASLYSGETLDAPMFDPDVLHNAFGTATAAPAGERRAASLLFHPSYAYEHFVMGLLPDAGPDGVVVKPHVGPLLELAHFASKDDHAALLLLDEFNRGNAAAIFGDTLALLDRDKRDVAVIETPYVHLKPTVTYGGNEEPLGPQTTLPGSLRILAAMNSADRSVAPLDAALRRRFAIVHVDPDINALSTHLGPDYEDGFVASDPSTWTTPEHVYAVAIRILETLNERIGYILGRDFLLGQSVFWHVIGDSVDEALQSLAAALDNRVLGTLALTFTDEDEALADVLNVTDTTTTPAVASWARGTGVLERYGRRLKVNSMQTLSLGDFATALVNLLGASAAAALDDAEDAEEVGHIDAAEDEGADGA
ncbi:AAA family ATPase [Nocardioides sp. NPDC092400]|uniref:McrB family protein n=1 Tax=Nocardioides sp. NPDC092400 TaxID=3155196 RepID=UPI003431DD9C